VEHFRNMFHQWHYARQVHVSQEVALSAVRSRPMTATTAATTEDVVCLAAQWIDEGRRVDLRAMSAELGVSRTTLHRRVGNRDTLLGRALWRLAEEAIRSAQARFDAGERPHRLESVARIMLFNQAVAAHRGLHRFLDDEPLTAVRVLTDSRGFVQPRIVAAVEEVLRRDLGPGDHEPPFARTEQLAYAVVRLSESFLYADAIADRTPDVDAANRLVAALVESWMASGQGTQERPSAR
jgi:AcrR family transcriptional regulator